MRERAPEGSRNVHELALMESLVATVEENLEEGRVTAVRLAVGDLSGVVIDALRFCFDVCAAGTRLEGATLEIRAVRGRGRCRACGAETELVSVVPVACGCGQGGMVIIAGDELRLVEVEVS